MKKKIVFVILHYKSYEDTIRCVNSILNMCKESFYEIVIVDNNSDNGTGEKIQSKYEGNKNVHVLIQERNLGFAKGNNVGYIYAKKELCADYIICLNNDTEIVDSYFCEKIFEIYEREKYYILGPDIIRIDGAHQNPYRKFIFSVNDVQKKVRNNRILLCYMLLKKKIPFLRNLKVLEEIYEKDGAQIKENSDYQHLQEQVTLQGACYIYSPEYVREEEFAFYPETFMYFEEAIICYLVAKKGKKIVYSPELSVKHYEGCSTKNSIVSEIDRKIFLAEKTIESGKLLLKLMENG